MQSADINEEIRGFLITSFLAGQGEKLRDDMALLGDVIDSSGVLELVGFLEERFAINVEDEDVTPDNLDSVNKVTAYVVSKLSNRPAASGR
jgi:acyl carrier protein